MARLVQRRSNCPISYALDLLGDKWSLLIVRDMVFERKTQYGEFLQSEEKIATNILADRLERLETQGLISRVQDAENLTKFHYKLTEKGMDLLPVLLELIVWSAKYDRHTAATKKFVTRIRQDQKALVNEIRATHML